METMAKYYTKRALTAGSPREQRRRIQSTRPDGSLVPGERPYPISRGGVSQHGHLVCVTKWREGRRDVRKEG